MSSTTKGLLGLIRPAALCAALGGAGLGVLSLYATGPIQMALASISAFCGGW
jgi:hypothetical protein